MWCYDGAIEFKATIQIHVGLMFLDVEALSTLSSSVLAIPLFRSRRN